MKAVKALILLIFLIAITNNVRAEKLIPIKNGKKLLIGKEAKLTYRIEGKKGEYEIKAKIKGKPVPVKYNKKENQVEITIPPAEKEGPQDLKIYLISEKTKYYLRRGREIRVKIINILKLAQEYYRKYPHMSEKNRRFLRAIERIYGKILYRLDQFLKRKEKELIKEIRIEKLYAEKGEKGEIEITYPIEGASLDKKEIKVKGEIKRGNITEIKINGKRAQIEENTFWAKIELKNGENTIEVIGRDEYNREIKKEIKITSIWDTDGDGLSAEEEEKYGTNPEEMDTDNDGLPDGMEINIYHTDPLKKDTDGDGLTDWEEDEKTHTNPLKADTDGDRLTDKEETEKSETDPLKADTDKDGLNDWEEFVLYDTIPTETDTDLDGISDGLEVNMYKTSPFYMDTDRDGLLDSYELKISHTNPLIKDTDKDGYIDGREVKEKTSPTDSSSYPEGEKDKYVDIYNIRLEKSEKGETIINFETNIPCRILIYYGIDSSMENLKEENEAIINHRINLGILLSNRQYVAIIESYEDKNLEMPYYFRSFNIGKTSESNLNEINISAIALGVIITFVGPDLI